MAEVLFGQSYYLRFDPKLWQAMQPYPPLGTMFAAACLRDRGYDVALFDAMLASGEAEWMSAVEEARPRFAVLFEDNFNYLSKMCLLRMRDASYAMLAAARQAGCTTVVCGSDATDHAADYLDHGAEYVIHGEGEGTLGELLDHLSGRHPGALAEIAGISYRDDAGELQRTAPRPVLKDLDALPLPAWDLVDVERYRRLWRRRHGHFSINMVTTRGCPYHCNWCAKPIWGQTYHLRSPEHVVSEMRLLHERYRPDHLWFADDIMGLKRGWLARFADELEAAGVEIPYKCLSRADLLLREGEIEALARSGCRVVWVGAESGSQKILDAMEKGTRVEQIREAARRLQEAGVGVGFFLQFGYPGETREDVEATRALVRECRPDEIGMSVSYPLPGTRFHQRVQAQMGDKRNWVDSADLDMMYRGPFDTAFYRQLIAVTQKEFRLRAGVKELGAMTRRPRTAAPRHLYRAGAVGYHLLTLPLARWKMERLARRPHRGAEQLPAGISAEEAARPSAQGEG